VIATRVLSTVEEPLQGHLRLDDPAGPVNLFANRVVRYHIDGAVLFSWHGDLSRYRSWSGMLSLGDGTDTAVFVDPAFLRSTDRTGST
jgi:hypothetical protein